MKKDGLAFALNTMRQRVAASIFFVFFCCQAEAADTELDVAFSPEQGATKLVIKALSEAHRSIRVAAYSFTSRPIAQALGRAKK
jgi:hypothetical protein